MFYANSKKVEKVQLEGRVYESEVRVLKACIDRSLKHNYQSSLDELDWSARFSPEVKPKAWVHTNLVKDTNTLASTLYKLANSEDRLDRWSDVPSRQGEWTRLEADKWRQRAFNIQTSYLDEKAWYSRMPGKVLLSAKKAWHQRKISKDKNPMSRWIRSLQWSLASL